MNTFITVLFVAIMGYLLGYLNGFVIAEHRRQKYDAYIKANCGRIAPRPNYKIPTPPREKK